MSDTYVPLISSGTAGPLGVLHLPRLWQGFAGGRGKLAEGYPGLVVDTMPQTCSALGLDEQAVKDYIMKERPTYPEFEARYEKCDLIKRSRDRSAQRRRPRDIITTTRPERASSETATAR